MFSKRVIKIFILAIIFLATIFYPSACKNKAENKNGYYETEGIQHRLIAFEDQKVKIQKGNYILLDAKYRLENDSVFWSSKKHPDSDYYFQLNDSLLNKKTFRLLSEQYSEGDSIELKIKTTDFFKDFFQGSIPDFGRKSEHIIANLRIIKSMTADEWKEFKNGIEFTREARLHQQKELIESWVNKNMRNPVMADSLLFYEITETSKEPLLKEGSLEISYSGYFLNGEMVEQILPTNPLFFQVGREDQLIPGLEKIIERLKRKESAKIILPSWLGFGEKGSENGLIPPNTPLVYELKLMN